MNRQERRAQRRNGASTTAAKTGMAGYYEMAMIAGAAIDECAAELSASMSENERKLATAICVSERIIDTFLADLARCLPPPPLQTGKDLTPMLADALARFITHWELEDRKR
jgi:hypothetical protein